jgi:tetratricopeptide (TPR) repeat protein
MRTVNRKRLKRVAQEPSARKTSGQKEERYKSHEHTLFGIRSEVLVCLFLALTTLAVYWQVRNYDFVNIDDGSYVYENRHVQSGLALENAIWSFTAIHASNWHPLTSLSHMLDCQLFGMNPGWHHLINLFLHILNTLLLFIVFRKMTGNLWQSAFVAALFAIHPLHVESVAWISERKDVLSTFFWLLTMWSYAWYVEHQRIDRYLLVFLFFILGLMSKPMLVTLPFVLILLDFWPLNRIQIEQADSSGSTKQWPILRRIVLEKIPFLAIVLISSVITFLVQKHSGAVNSLDMAPLFSRIANALVSYVGYIGKMVWPSSMAVLYPFPHMIPWWKVAGAGFFLISISLLAIRGMKQRPYLAVGWFWYIGTLVPVIGLVKVGNHSMADRYTYIPFIGLFIIIAWGISEFVKRWRLVKTFLPVMAAAILFIFMAVTFYQVQYWENSIALFEHTLEVTSNNSIAHNNLGNALEKQGRVEEAIKHYMEALRVNPYSAEAHNNLGIALQAQGRVEEAIKHYMEALRVKPDDAKAHCNLGNAIKNQDRVEEAIKHYLEALRINPYSAEAHNNLGFALQGQGRVEEAIKHYMEALRIKPDYAKAHCNLGNALKQQDRVEEAIKHYLEAVRIKPDYAEAHYNLGIALQVQGRVEEALMHYLEALRVNPYSAEAHNNLGFALQGQGRVEEAIKHYMEALRLNPYSAEAHNNLGIALALKGDIDGAIEHFRKALKINPNYIGAKNNLKKALTIQKQGQ